MATWLKSIGFAYDTSDASGHPIYVWPATGERVKLPTSPRGHVWVDNTRKDASRIAGVDISNKRDTQRIKDREKAARDKRAEDRERRKQAALRDLRRRDAEQERRQIDRQITRRRNALKGIERLMREKPYEGGAL